MRLTDRQKDAVLGGGCDITVSASAGAGKTGVLIERLYSLIACHSIKVNQILAMTFTSAAAQEMRKRLYSRLAEGIADPKTPEDIRAFLEEQKSLLPSADICTIDSFCKKMISNYSYVLKWDPARFSNVFDTSMVELFKKEAARNVILNHVKTSPDDPALFYLLETTSANGNDTAKLEDALISIGTALSSYADPQQWIDHTRALYEDALTTGNLPDEITVFYYRTRKKMADTAKALLDAYYSIASSYNPDMDNLDQFYGDLEKDLQAYGNACDRRDASAIIQSVAKISGTSVPTLSKELKVRRPKEVSSEDWKELTKPFKKSHDDLKKYLSAFAEADTLKEGVEQLNRLRGPVNKMLDMVIDYRKEFALIKEKNNGIDFEDMEHGALEILKADHGRIAKVLQDQYEHIMVDEYQDSNDLQEGIVQLICKKNPRNVFRVGDVKQSIYSFRSARPELMRSFVHNPSKDNQVIYFDKNFRSKDTLVRFNNELYKIIMNVEGYADSYGKDDCVITGLDSQQEDCAPVELCLFDRKEFPAKSLAEFREARANYLVRRIAEAEKGSESPRWNRYVVLVRSNITKNEIEPAFKAAGIPCFFIARTGFYSDEAVMTVLSWMRVLDDPEDEISLFSLLTSPYYNLSAHELVKLRTELKQTGAASYYRLLQQTRHQAAIDIENFRSLSRKVPLDELLRALLGFHEYQAKYTSASQRDNLDLFAESVSQAVKQQLDLHSFLLRVDAAQRTDQGSATSISEDANVVRITTIHSSKGLEYDTVFYLADTLCSTRASGDCYFMDSELGLTLKDVQLPYMFSQSPLLWELMEDKKRQENVEEAIRLMYVATTRAKRRMVIIGLEDESMPLKPVPALLEKYAGNNAVSGNLFKYAAVRMASTGTVEYHKIAKDTAVPFEGSFAMDQKERVSGRLYEQPLQPLKSYAPSSTEKRKLYPITPGRKDGAQRGTLMHKALELLDFDNYRFEDLSKLPFKLSESDQKKVDLFFHTPEFATLKTMEVHKEYPFMLWEDEELVHGFIDLAAIGEKEIWLVDYKSDRSKNDEEFLEEYSAQLNGYRHALEAHFHLPVRAFLYSLELGRFIRVPGEDEQ